MRAIITIGVIGFVSLAGAAFAADAPADLAQGKAQFTRWCAICHSPVRHDNGLLPGTLSLQVKYQGTKPAALEERDDLPAAYVTLVIRHGTEGMPTFRKTEISDKDMDDIAAYLARNTK